jgi:hypothetical protein
VARSMLSVVLMQGPSTRPKAASGELCDAFDRGRHEQIPEVLTAPLQAVYLQSRDDPETAAGLGAGASRVWGPNERVRLQPRWVISEGSVHGLGAGKKVRSLRGPTVVNGGGSSCRSSI